MPKSNNSTGLFLVELCSHPAVALVAPPPTLGLSLPQLSQHSHKEPVVTVRPAAGSSFRFKPSGHNLRPQFRVQVNSGLPILLSDESWGQPHERVSHGSHK